MTKNAEGTTGNLTADLAALRKDIAHLAETMSELVQHQTGTAGHRVSEVAGDVKDRIARYRRRRAESCLRGGRRNRGLYRAQFANGGADRARRRTFTRPAEPITGLIVHGSRTDRSLRRCG